MTLETDFPVPFTARLALKEKQVQQSYRPIIGIHKWFARRPGTVFRSLLLAEFNGPEPVEESFFRSHQFGGTIADPFAGGGTPAFEANRLGFSVVAADINPMAYWIVRQGLAPLNLADFSSAAERVIADVEQDVRELYLTSCERCLKPVAVKYFIWVKIQDCPECAATNDLFPGYLLAEDERHPRNVLVCSACGALNECEELPSAEVSAPCYACERPLRLEGPARRNKMRCGHCQSQFSYPPKNPTSPPLHRMWAIEYQCPDCKPGHAGRFFKRPDEDDLARVSAALARVTGLRSELPIPTDPISDGDETKRLHRWGYRRFSEMFNDRQLLGLGTLLNRILAEPSQALRHALLTVFSDFLRYQNMLCRYDTYALKCQDIFSVHGFPVGLVQCENNLLGIPRVGSGSFRHFVKKYIRAKEYGARPFETIQVGKRKIVKYIVGECIAAPLTDHVPLGNTREAFLVSGAATGVALAPDSLDGVFTDPPYFDAVQYAELMDFCYAWLRIGLATDVPAFRASSSRHAQELTGNSTMGRDLEHFADGLSGVFVHYARALKPGAPFVFTYHHNDPSAYAPIVLAILDAGLTCTAVLPAPAEMGASLHISGTSSSVLDSIFVCRRDAPSGPRSGAAELLTRDIELLQEGGVRVSQGDIRCLSSGHAARIAVNTLRPEWRSDAAIAIRLDKVRGALALAAQAIADARIPDATQLALY